MRCDLLRKKVGIQDAILALSASRLFSSSSCTALVPGRRFQKMPPYFLNTIISDFLPVRFSILGVGRFSFYGIEATSHLPTPTVISEVIISRLRKPIYLGPGSLQPTSVLFFAPVFCFQFQLKMPSGKLFHKNAPDLVY